MDRVVDAIGFAWVASPTLCLALRTRSLGLKRSARLAVGLSLALLLAALSVFFKLGEPATRAVVIATWTAGGALCIALGSAALRAAQGLETLAIGLRVRLRMLSLGWWGMAIVFGAFAVGALLAPDSDLTLMVSYGAGLSTWLAIVVASVGLARRHSARGASGLARVGFGLTAWSIGFFIVPLLAALEFVPAAFAFLTVGLFPIVLPIATRLLVGAGPEPLDLAIHVAPPDDALHGASSAPARIAAKQAALATLGFVAFGVQALTFSLHDEQCGGALVDAPAPPHWQALPASAAHGYNRLGPFLFRAGHFDYKGYPAAYEDPERRGDSC